MCQIKIFFHHVSTIKDENNQNVMFFVMFRIVLVYSYMREILVDQNSVLMCMLFRIHCYVAAPLPMPEIIDPVFAKTSQNARFLLSENERFGLVFVKTGSINSGTSS